MSTQSVAGLAKLPLVYAIIIRFVMLVSDPRTLLFYLGNVVKKCCFQNEKIKKIVGCYSVFLLIFTLLCITRTSFFIPFLGYIKDMEVGGALEEDPDSRKLFAIELQLRQLVLLVVKAYLFFVTLRVAVICVR